MSQSLRAPAPSWSSTASSAPPDGEARPRVLLIDGASRLCDAVQHAFDGAGYDVHVLTDACGLGEALASAPDLVLIDVNAAGTGFALCGELRTSELGAQVPAVLVTSDALDEQLVARGLFCGADDVLSVGDRPLEFRARVRVQLRHKRDRDRLKRVRAERDRFRREAVLDPLTGLPNRRAIDSRLEEAVAGGGAFAYVILDVDDFKRVNDRLGHDVGDRVLRAVAQSIERTLRPGDHAGRYGGEEFVLLLPGAGAAEALAQAERHRRAVESALIPALGPGGRVTASFGVALFDRGAPDLSRRALSQRADEALYEAKRCGKNRVVIARPSAMLERSSLARTRSATTQAVREALEVALLKQLSVGRVGLPMLPEAASEALRLAEDPGTDMIRIARLVDRDPPLAARFVATAGSALYARGVRLTSTQTALVRIGLAAARDLLLQVVYERSNEELPMFRDEVARSFARSVRSAIAARVIAPELHGAHDYAYLCGLLHDIGEARIYRILAEMPMAAAHDEFARELVTRHHPRAGADVARAWSLPGDIVEACACHHAEPEGASLSVRLVIGADALVRLVEQRAQGLPYAHDDTALLIRAGVAPARVQHVVDRLQVMARDASRPAVEG